MECFLFRDKEEIKEKIKFSLKERKIKYVELFKKSIDFFVQKTTFYLVKALMDANSLTYHAALDMNNTSCFFNALPIVVSLKYKSQTIPTNKVYRHQGIYIMNACTFEKLLEDNFSFSLVFKGKSVRYIDKEKLKSLRKKYEYSLADVADKIGVSKKSLYMLERYGKGSASIVEKLETLFLENISIPLPLNTAPEYVQFKPHPIPHEKPFTHTFSFSWDALVYSQPKGYVILDDKQKAKEAINLHKLSSTHVTYVLKHKKYLKRIKREIPKDKYKII